MDFYINTIILITACVYRPRWIADRRIDRVRSVISGNLIVGHSNRSRSLIDSRRLRELIDDNLGNSFQGFYRGSVGSRDCTEARNLRETILCRARIVDHPEILRRSGIVIQLIQFRRPGDCSRHRCVIVAERTEQTESENEQYRSFFKDHVLMNAANKATLITRPNCREIS